MNKLIKIFSHPFILLVFNKLKEIFISKEYKNFTTSIKEEEQPIKPIVIPQPIEPPKKSVTKKSVASKPVIKKSTKKSTKNK
jgi:hypothetical protein